MTRFLLHIWKERKRAGRKKKGDRALKDGSDKGEEEEGGDGPGTTEVYV